MKNYNLQKILLFLILVFCFQNLKSWTLEGRIFDQETQKIVSDAHIFLENEDFNKKMTVSQEDGSFVFKKLKAGEYQLKISHLSYQDFEKKIIIGKQKLQEQRFFLASKAYLLDEIVLLEDFEKEISKEVISFDKPEKITGIALEEILLKSSANVKINENGKLAIRGSKNNHTIIMVDGMKLNSALYQDFDLNTIAPASIEKVEIYKSGNLGLSATGIGGIINIVTKENFENNQTRISFSEKYYQSDRDKFKPEGFNNHNFSIFKSFKIKNHQFYASLQYQDFENNFSYINAAKVDRYRYLHHPNIPRINEGAAEQKLNFNFKDKFDFREQSFILSYLLAYSQDDLYGNYDFLFSNSYQKSLRQAFNLKWKRNRLEFQTVYSQLNKHTLIDSKMAIYKTDSKEDLTNLFLKLSYYYTVWFGIGIDNQLEYERETADSPKINGLRKRNNFSLVQKMRFAHSFSSKRRLTNQAIIRLYSNTINKKFIFLFSEELSFRQRFNEITDLNLSLKYSKSMNLPDFSSLFWINNTFSSGNQNLKEEISRTIEGRSLFEMKFGDSKVELENTIYYKRLKDLIIWVKNSSGKYIPINKEGGLILGNENRLSYFYLDYFDLNWSLNFMDTRAYTNKNSTDNKRIIYRPFIASKINSKLRIANFEIFSLVNYTGKMYLNETNSIDIDPFYLVDAGISYQRKLLDLGKINLKIQVKNLLDEQYQLVYQIPMPGRSYQFTINYQFN